MMKLYIRALTLVALLSRNCHSSRDGNFVHSFLRQNDERRLQEPAPAIVGDKFEMRISNAGDSVVTPVTNEDGTLQNFKIKVRDRAS